jgi:hypothetical protein
VREREREREKVSERRRCRAEKTAVRKRERNKEESERANNTRRREDNVLHLGDLFSFKCSSDVKGYAFLKILELFSESIRRHFDTCCNLALC